MGVDVMSADAIWLAIGVQYLLLLYLLYVVFDVSSLVGMIEQRLESLEGQQRHE